jgi:hypothetical protein
MFKFFDLATNAQQEVDIVIPVEEASFFIVVDVEFFGVARCRQTDRLGGEIDCDDRLWIFFDGGEDLFQEFIADGDGQQEVIQCVVFEDIGEEAADDDIESGVFNSPGGVFAARSAAEVLTAHEDLAVVGRVIEDEIFFRSVVAIIAPVAEQVVAESIAAGGLEEAGGNDLVRVYVLQVKGNGGRCYFIDGFAHGFVLMVCRFFGAGFNG